MNIRRGLLIGLALLCFASATTLVPMSIEDMTRASAKIAMAQAQDSWVEWNAEHTLMYTMTRFHSVRALKGSDEQEFIVRQIGGRDHGIEQKVAGVKQFQTGDVRVLFLRQSNERPGSYVVTGLIQGNLKVMHEVNETFVQNDVSGITFYDPGKQANVPARNARMSLGELETRIARASTR